MESPTSSAATTPDIRFQLSLLRFLSQGEAPTPQIQQVEQLLNRALAAS